MSFQDILYLLLQQITKKAPDTRNGDEFVLKKCIDNFILL